MCFHGIHSGDGFARAYATGLHRDAGKLITVIVRTAAGMNARLERRAKS